MLGEFKWRLVNRVSRVLEPDERNAVLGDFAESGITSGKALRDLFSLVVRRQAALYKDWRPWAAFNWTRRTARDAFLFRSAWLIPRA